MTTPFTDRVCAVTGAGSGIGRALALGLADRGAHVVVSDRDGDAATTTGELARGRGAEVLVDTVDVTDRDDLDRHARAAVDRFGVVHQLYNNAGIAQRLPITRATTDDLAKVLDVNLWGVIHGTQALLPHLIASGDGHLINISSLNGYVAQADMTAYVTSKFAVRGFTEAVAADMARHGHPVRVSVVHPGGVATNIVNAATAEAVATGRAPTDGSVQAVNRTYNERLLRMDPARAATIVLDGVARGSTRILVGRDARALDLLSRVLPGRYVRLVERVERRLLPGLVVDEGAIGAADVAA